MEKPTCLLKSTPNALQHIFESVKNDVVIPKIVVYLPIENNPNLYQLVFGNLMPNGEIDTLSVSNNDDMKIILTTVVKTLFSFFELNPDKVVIFTGSTLSRTRLYRAVISKFINETELFYEIKGITENGVLEKFQSNQTYLGYLIQHRK